MGLAGQLLHRTSCGKGIEEATDVDLWPPNSHT